MIEARPHSIQKVFLEVNVNSEKYAYEVKDAIDDFLKDQLLPHVEKYLESIGVGNDYNLEIESLRVVISTNKGFIVESSSGISLEISKQLKEQLDTVFVAHKTLTSSQLENQYFFPEESSLHIRTLLYFLNTGKFPWWIDDVKGDDVSVDALLYKSIGEKHFYTGLNTFIKKPAVQKRLVYQLSDIFLGIIIPKLSIKAKQLKFSSETGFQKSIAKIPLALRHIIWELLINYAIDNPFDTLKVKNYPAFFSSESDRDEQLQNATFILKELQKYLPLSPSETEFFKAITKVSSTELNYLEGEELDLKVIPKEGSSSNSKSNKISKNRNDPEQDLYIDDSILEISKNNILDNTQDQESNPVLSPKSKDTKTSKEIDIIDYSEEHYDIIDSDTYYVSHAGLILLHPFLKSFFKNCELLNHDNSITNPTLAVHLLHYLATGKEKQYEQLHLMEKFLCGQSLAAPIEREIELSKTLKNKANELLKAVLGHIPQLKSNSIPLFQNEFLQRPGKLSLESNKERLIVERKTQDILLDNLAWNLSIIKLPWQKRIFYTDW